MFSCGFLMILLFSFFLLRLQIRDKKYLDGIYENIANLKEPLCLCIQIGQVTIRTNL